MKNTIQFESCHSVCLPTVIVAISVVSEFYFIRVVRIVRRQEVYEMFGSSVSCDKPEMETQVSVFGYVEPVAHDVDGVGAVH